MHKKGTVKEVIYSGVQWYHGHRLSLLAPRASLLILELPSFNVQQCANPLTRLNSKMYFWKVNV